MARGRPLSQVEVEQQLMEYCELREEATEEFGEALGELATAEAAYKKAKARSYLTGKGTQKDREFNADFVTADLLEEFKAAEGKVKHLREVLSSHDNKIGALRTLNSNIRTQV